MNQLSRRRLLATGTALAATAAAPAALAGPAADITAEQDFDELWQTLRERYCFFDDKATDWGRVRALYRPQAVAAETNEAYREIIRQVLNELYDAHTHLNDNADGSPSYDLLVEPSATSAVVREVRDDSAASRAGLVTGDVILAVDATPVAQLAAAHLPRCLRRPDPAATRYALNVAVAGLRGRPRRLTLAAPGGETRDVDLPLSTAAQEPDLAYRSLDGGLGLIRISTFADTETIARFDAALEALKDAPGLILDVRRNGGGDTAVGRPIMGRFIAERKPYARMRRREGGGLGEAWTEYVDPRGPFTYARPVVVLTDAWSGSMAEGFPMGMKGIGRATIVGRPMMGLGAAVFSIRLDRTGLSGQYSAEPVYDIEDRPRLRMQPDVVTAEGQDIEPAGVDVLRRLIAAGA
jgi:carboxyl-terminal processing protease